MRQESSTNTYCSCDKLHLRINHLVKGDVSGPLRHISFYLLGSEIVAEEHKFLITRECHEFGSEDARV